MLSQNYTALIKRWGPLALLLAFLIFSLSMGWHKYLQFNTFIRQYDVFTTFINQNFVTSLLIYIVIYIIVVVLSLPGGSFMTIFGGVLFGAWIGGLSALLSASIGALVLFVVVQHTFGDFFASISGKWVTKMREGFLDNEFSYMLFLRLVPVAPFFIVNVAPAIIGVSMKNYAIATLIGMIPGAFAYAYVGEGLVSVIEAQKRSNAECLEDVNCEIEINFSELITFEIFSAFIVLGCLSLLPVLIKYYKERASKA